MPEVLSPDPDRYAPVAALKARGNSQVGLVREASSGHMYVVRCLPITCDPALASTWPRLHHPGVQLFVGAVEGPDALWLLSEFVAGHPVNEAVKLQTFSCDWVLLWMQLLLEALDFLHGQNLMLGRLRPSDVVLGMAGPVIVDLGYTEHLSLQLLPQALTPFDPPECISSFAPTVQMDLFCVGAIATFMMTGSPPLASGPETRKKLAALQNLPLLLIEVLASMVHPLPAGRPESVEAVRSMLEPLLHREFPRVMVPEELVPDESAPAPWLSNSGPSREIRGRSLVRTLRVMPDVKTPTPRQIQDVSLIPAEHWRSCAVLKRSTFSTVVLLEHRESKRLAVGHLLHPPPEVPPPQALEACASLADKLSLLRHERIPQLLEFLPQGPWFISDFMQGYPADQVHDEMDAGWVVLWMTQLLELYRFLHEQGIVLARLEPSDVVLGGKGACIVDLRIFEQLFPKTAMLSMLSNQAYVAPERRSPGRDEPSQDLYSLAAVAWTLLSRTPPGPEDGLLEAMREKRPDVPPALVAVLTRMLLTHPSRRYRSAAEALEALADLPSSINDPPSGKLKPTPREAAPWVPESDWLPDRPPEEPKPRWKPSPVPAQPTYVEAPVPLEPVPETRPRPPVALLAGVVLLLLLLAAMHGRQPAASGPEINTPVLLTVSEGRVEVQGRPGPANEVRAGEEVQADDAQVKLQTPDMDAVCLALHTRLRPNRPDKGPLLLAVLHGRLWCHARHADVRVSVPGALVVCPAPSSAEFDLTLDRGRGCLVVCRSGSLAVKAALGHRSDLVEGQSLKIFPSGMTAAGVTHEPDPWEAWNLQQDGAR
ncbi:MAG: protein kinase domain-containing protein [Candidatus Xenobia bacterium]